MLEIIGNPVIETNQPPRPEYRNILAPYFHGDGRWGSERTGTVDVTEVSDL